MQPFLITGLPRSRTAWLSAVCMMIPDAVCFHEPIEYAPSWQESLEIWHSFPKYKYIGISDSSLSLHLEEILAVYKPRTLIIDRPLDEVKDSLRNIGVFSNKLVEIKNERLSKISNLKSDLIMKVDYYCLNLKLSECLNHLMPGCLIDEIKLSMMLRLNIQENLKRVRFSSDQRKYELDKILGDDVVKELKLA